MKHSLMTKMILIIVAVGVIGFALISTVAASRIEKKLILSESRDMYREASSIAGDKSLLTLS